VRKLTHPRTIPDSPIYFSVDVPGKGPHAFRLPRPSMAARLVSPMISSGIWDAGESGAKMSQASALLTEEAVGAAVGTCWRHETLEIEAKRSHHDRDADGLLDYGSAVLEELYEEGYSTEDLTPIISAVGSRLLTSILPGPAEVAEQVNFTAPGPALAT